MAEYLVESPDQLGRSPRANAAIRKYRIVTMGSNGRVAETGAASVPFGIAKYDTAINTATALNAGGVCIVMANATTAIDEGDLVGPGANGLAVKKTADADWTIGRVIVGAASGNPTPILIQFGITQRAS